MRDYFSEIDWHLFSDVSRMQELMKMGSGMQDHIRESIMSKFGLFQSIITS